ncbi:MAG: DMT family transporter [Aggregatilineales bacterium]
MTEITEALPVPSEEIHEETPPRAYLVLVIGILAVALAAILIRLAQAEAMPSLLIAAGRLILAALILTPATLRNPMFMKQIRALTRFEGLLIGISGLFLAMHFASWVTSLEYTTVLISVVLVTTSSIWVALMEVFLLRGRLANSVIVGLVIVLIGSIVIGSGSGIANGSSGDQLYGGLLAAFGALTVAVYMIIGKRLRPKLSLIPYIWMVYGTAAIILSIALLVTATPITGFSTEGYLWLVALALIPQLVGHSSLNYALGYLPATFVSIATQAEPIGSAIIAYFVFTEIPDIWQIIGSVVILGGVIFASVGQNRANNRSK